MTKKRTNPLRSRNVTPEGVQEIVRREVGQLVVRQHVSISGPLPVAVEAERYEKLLPGFTDRFVKIAEKAQDDDIASRKREDVFSLIWSLATLFVAFLITGGALAGGVYLIAQGKEVAGYASLIGAGGLILTSLWQRSKKSVNHLGVPTRR